MRPLGHKVFSPAETVGQRHPALVGMPGNKPPVGCGRCVLGGAKQRRVHAGVLSCEPAERSEEVVGSVHGRQALAPAKRGLKTNRARPTVGAGTGFEPSHHTGPGSRVGFIEAPFAHRAVLAAEEALHVGPRGREATDTVAAEVGFDAVPFDRLVGVLVVEKGLGFAQAPRKLAGSNAGEAAENLHHRPAATVVAQRKGPLEHHHHIQAVEPSIGSRARIGKFVAIGHVAAGAKAQGPRHPFEAGTRQAHRAPKSVDVSWGRRNVRLGLYRPRLRPDGPEGVRPVWRDAVVASSSTPGLLRSLLGVGGQKPFRRRCRQRVAELADVSRDGFAVRLIHHLVAEHRQGEGAEYALRRPASRRVLEGLTRAGIRPRRGSGAIFHRGWGEGLNGVQVDTINLRANVILQNHPATKSHGAVSGG